MKYAVVISGNKQYKVAEGDVVEVESLSLKANDPYTFEQVLMAVDGDTTKVGTPTLSGVTVSGTVVAQVKGPKIRVAKFKAKARYRRVTGFRAQKTQVKVEKITLK